MARYKVSATFKGKRITTSKYWNSKRKAQQYADETNRFYRRAYARVIKI